MSDSFLSGKRVLIIDDTDIVREGLIMLYQSLGMEVIAACKSGEEGLGVLDKENPDIVSLDVIMPDMHGIEVYNRIKKKNAEQNVIFLTCLASDPNFAASFENIEDGLFHQKPQNTERLRSILHQFFGVDKDSASESSQSSEGSSSEPGMEEPWAKKDEGILIPDKRSS